MKYNFEKGEMNKKTKITECFIFFGMELKIEITKKSVFFLTFVHVKSRYIIFVGGE